MYKRQALLWAPLLDATRRALSAAAIAACDDGGAIGVALRELLEAPAEAVAMRDSPWATAGVDASSKPVWSQLSLELRRLIASFGVLLRAAHSQYSLLATAAAAADASADAAAKPPVVSDDVQRLCGLLVLQLLRKAESAVVDATSADATAAAPAAAPAPADDAAASV